MFYEEYRDFLKDNIRLQVDFRKTEQNRGVPMPPVEKPLPDPALLTPLPDWRAGIKERQTALEDLIEARVSRRKFSSEPIQLEELSFLLWATQGVRRNNGAGIVWRTVPSAGNRHSLETYLAIQQVAQLNPGLYRYLPLEHALLYLGPIENHEERVGEAALGQGFVGKAPATFFWTTVPGRMEWRYGEASYKVIALDAGHVCQNLYLAAQAVGCGTCAIAAYNQGAADRLLGVDGEEEFVIYLAPVGHMDSKS